MSYGYAVFEYKSPEDGPPVRIPRSPASSKKWVKIVEFADLALGVSSLECELGWDNPTVKPPNIKVEWRKAGDDPSKRQALVVGTERAGADTGTTTEKIAAADLPLSLWIWHDAPDSDLLLTKVIAKVDNPVALIVKALEGLVR